MQKDLQKTILNIDKNLYMRVININDVTSEYLSWLNDYEITKFTEQKNIKHTFNSLEKYVLEKFNSKNNFLFGIFHFNRHIGNIKLGPIENKDGSAEVSFLIGNKDYWGKGITTKALKRLIDFGIEELGIKKFIAGYYINNEASARVFKKCLFKVDKINKKFKNFEGQPIDTVSVELIVGSGNSFL